MFKKILVPTDFSAYVRKVLECIGDIPGLTEVVLLNVVARDPLARVWDPVAEAREAEKKLAGEKKYFKAPGVNVKVRAVSALEGDIPEAINQIAKEEDVQIVVMGAHGRSLISSALLGSSSRNVLRFGDRHLLIMRYRMPGESDLGPVGPKATWVKIAEPPKGPEVMEKYCARVFSKVLVPTDFSQPAEAAISFVKDIGNIGEIVLLHVVSKGESKEEIDARIEDATKKLNGIVMELGKGGLKVTPRVAVGSPVDIICSMAEEEDVSLIAMSSVGKDTLRTGRIGSRTYDVANSAKRPILVVRLKPVFEAKSA
jgi:nucleotide-binding universal stress UspA family protein